MTIWRVTVERTDRASDEFFFAKEELADKFIKGFVFHFCEYEPRYTPDGYSVDLCDGDLIYASAYKDEIEVATE